ncbi:putative Transmembrane protein [Melia azedarach]|uniref:Transmembrane protein n=1 Tax=Melia azedarach TaxID=155640 RepID=A0ACC1YHW9_MELAZ|nr:putative Transmembrane protein [Melia azedarach]
MGLLNIILAALVIILLHTQPCKAARVLPGEIFLKNELRLQSLQQGPVTPPGGSSCTYIPGTGGHGCPVKEMNVAGDVFSHSSAYPRLMTSFGVATNNK